MNRRFLTTDPSDFTRAGDARSSHGLNRIAARAGGVGWNSFGRADWTRLYPTTDAELRQHLRLSLGRTLTTLALIAGALAAFVVLATFRTHQAAGPAVLSTLQAGGSTMLYLTAALTVAALFYLGYAMIRPERF